MLTRPRPPIRPLAAVLLVLAAALLVITGAGVAKAPKVVRVRTAHNTHLHRTVLTTAHGRTLYSLSSEAHGHFDCTGSCLSVWKPLLVPRGAKLVGPKGLKGRLTIVRRPDTHRRQAAYRGHPLYTFTGDMKKGDANGEGVRDVGVWHAASPPKPKPKPPAPAPAPSPSPTY